MPRTEVKMEKVCISLPGEQIKQSVGRVNAGQFSSFSDFIRAAVREYNEHHPFAPEAAACPTA